MLKIENLSKKFDGFEVLKSVNIHVEKGQIYGLAGTNGSGKTTIFKHIMKIYNQDIGNIYYDGNNIKNDDNYFSDFYYIQDDLFFPYNYSINDLFNYEKMLYSNASNEKYEKLLKYFNIDSFKKLRSLSKGQKKQAAFILAISTCPKVLLLDEIVDGLDAVVRRKFWNVILEEVMDNNITVLISSHALTELDNICDKIGILHEGRIVKEETMEHLKEDIIKVQFAIDEEFKIIESDEYNVVKFTKIGSVYFAVLKGNVEEFKKNLNNKYNVILFDKLSMNLEEIFISELGGLGYGTEEYKA